MASDFDMDRRGYLATVGAAGVAGLAGCPGDGGNGTADDGVGTDDGTATPDDGGPTGEDVIRLATAADFPPFAYVEDGALVGLDVALAETVVERAGYEIGTWADIRFEALVPELNADQFDMVTAAMSTALGREEEIAFTTPYYETHQAVLVRSDGEFHPEEESDLEGNFLGAQTSTTSAAEIERLIEEEILTEDDYRQFVDFGNAILALADETLDGVVADVTAAEVAADGTEEADLEVAFTIETDEEYALAMRTDDDRLEDVDEALTEIMEDGTYDDLVAEHIGDDGQ